MKTVDHTVHATSGKLAASCKETLAGTGRTWPAGTATFSAYPPPPTRAHTFLTHQNFIITKVEKTHYAELSYSDKPYTILLGFGVFIIAQMKTKYSRFSLGHFIKQLLQKT